MSNTTRSPAAAAHLDQAFRLMIANTDAVVNASAVRVATGEPHPFGNFAVFPPSVTTGEVVRELQPLLSVGAPSAALFCGPLAADALEAIEAMGYSNAGAMPAMTVSLDALGHTALPQGYEFARVAAGAAGDAWADAFAIGYEVPRAAAEYFSPSSFGATLDPASPVQHFAITHEGQTVATSTVVVSGGIAGVYCVATIAEHRGRGLGAHATAEPLRRMASLHNGLCVLQSSAAGHSVYRRLGFGIRGELRELTVRMNHDHRAEDLGSVAGNQHQAVGREPLLGVGLMRPRFGDEASPDIDITEQFENGMPIGRPARTNRNMPGMFKQIAIRHRRIYPRSILTRCVIGVTELQLNTLLPRSASGARKRGFWFRGESHAVHQNYGSTSSMRLAACCPKGSCIA